MSLARSHRVLIGAATLLSLALFQTGCSHILNLFRRSQSLSPVALYQKVSSSVFVVESLGQNGERLMLGSAVAVRDDLLITNCHVVQDSWFLRVRRAKETWSATLIQASPEHDLCGLSVGSGQPQQWDPVIEFRQKWPIRPQGPWLFYAPWPQANYSDEEILRYLQDPAKFRLAFPNYDGLTDDQIRTISANHMKPRGPYLATVNMIPSSGLATGERVYAIGAPQGFELTFSEGVISALRDTEGVRMIQTSAPISPGSSGGGLFDATGNLVGVTSFQATEGQNLNFALPSEWVTALLESLNRTSQKPVSERRDERLEATAWLQIGEEALKNKNNDLAGHSFLKSANLKVGDAYEAWLELGELWSNDAGTTMQHDWRCAEIECKSLFVDEKEASDKAIAAVEESIALRPDYGRAWNILAGLHAKRHEYDQAISCEKEATRLSADDSWNWMMLGSYYIDTKSYSAASEALQKAEKLAVPAKNWSVLEAIGIYYSIMNDRRQVMRIYEELKTFDPGKAEGFFKGAVIFSAEASRRKTMQR